MKPLLLTLAWLALLLSQAVAQPRPPPPQVFPSGSYTPTDCLQAAAGSTTGHLVAADAGAPCGSGGGGTPGGTSGQIQFNNSSAFGGFTASGDCTINTGTGAVTCTKTSGTAFTALATTAPGTGVATALGVATNATGGIILPPGEGAVGVNSSGAAVSIGTGQGVDTGPGTYNVLIASAMNSSPMKNDGVSVCAGTVVISGGNTVTVSGSPVVCGSNATAWGGFAPGDVGKDIILPGAGSTTNIPCVVVIGAYSSSAAVGYSTTKGAGCANGTYTLSFATGVVMTYGTDNTSAWNTLIGNLVGTNWAIEQGGTIYFPAGIYVFDGNPTTIPGALGIKAVMVIPDRELSSGGSLVSPPFRLNIVGQDSVKAAYSVISEAQEIPETGTILISGRGDATGYSVFMGGASTNGFDTFNNVTLYAKDITFRTYNNPQLGGPWMGYMQGASFDDVTVDVGTGAGFSNITVNTLVPGIVMPYSNNGTVSLLNHTNVLGYATCYVVSEHIDAPWIEGYFCGLAGVQVQLTAPTGGSSYHTLHIGHAAIQETPIALYQPGSVGPINVVVDDLDIEYAPTGAYARTATISDANNEMHGTINYSSVEAGVGSVTSAVIVGSKNVKLNDLNSTYASAVFPNATSTGTTLYTLTTLNAGTAVITSTSATSGIIGVTEESAGTSNSAVIATSGVAALLFDGTPTPGDFVQISASTAGYGHDAGSTCPSSGQIIGVETGSGPGSTYNVLLNTTGICPGSGGGSFANPSATAGPTAVNGSATTAMRSDAAPLVQKGSASQFGIVEADGSTITASGGVLSATATIGGGTVTVTGSAPITNNCAKFTGATTIADAGATCGGGGSISCPTGFTAATYGGDCIWTITCAAGSCTGASTANCGSGIQCIAWTGLTVNNYVVRCSTLIWSSASANTPSVQYGEGGTPTWGAGTSYVWQGSDQYTSVVPAGNYNTGTTGFVIGGSATNAGIIGQTFKADLFNLASTTTAKQIIMTSLTTQASLNLWITLAGYYYNGADTNAVTAVRVKDLGANNESITSGSCTMTVKGT